MILSIQFNLKSIYMFEKIQSMTGKVVRVNPACIREYTDENGKKGVFVADEQGHEVLDFEYLRGLDGEYDVVFDFYGKDLRHYTQGRDPYEVNTDDMKHLLKLKIHAPLSSEKYQYFEAKYFEVVKPVTTWVRDENYYDNRYMGCDSDYR